MNWRLLVLLGALALVPQLSAAAEERAEPADLCAVLNDPIRYQHKLIRVTGLVSRGFEDFSLSNSACKEQFGLWLEYGGPKPSETVYCCVGEESSQPNGRDPLRVEGIETSLRTDATFKRFDKNTKQLKRGRHVKATAVGRLFAAGTYTSDTGEEVSVGYGHFGMFSLLVIQEVIAVNQ
jgi:hypothetical protein